MNSYDPKNIEQKWQKIWEETNLYTTPENVTKENKMYILPQLPYPSGSGLHVGHAEVYTACDIYARYQRMIGKKVLQVIGWDAFGLPAENYAIKTNVHPRKSTNDAIDNFRKQITSLGISVDWKREVGSHNPDYYQWTQWFFLLMYKRGLAYRKKQSVNWCDSCKTVLANEQVTNAGTCERCDTVVVQKEMEQWYLKITEYVDTLLEGLDRIDWPEETKKRQRDWIGKSEGAEINFRIADTDVSVTVFTTRPDTIYGATYMVLAPEHALIQQWQSQISNWSDVKDYIKKTTEKTELDRQVDQEKTGVPLQGIVAVNPVSGEKIPVWIADYVLASYGTGAIMAVPAHDERDFAFAKKFGLEIKHVVAQPVGEREEDYKPRRSVRGICIQNGKVLLEFDKKMQEYVLPGGGIEEGEDIKEALVRELQEECGYSHVTVQKSLGCIEHSYFHHRLKNNWRVLESAYCIEIDTAHVVERPQEEVEKIEFAWYDLDEAIQLLSQKSPTFYRSTIFLEWAKKQEERCYLDEGIAIHSDFLDGLPTSEAKEKMIQYLEEKGIGKRKTQYKLRDWSVSRQRFWGAPIPMLYDAEGNLHPVPEADLPVILPDDVDFKPTGESPLRYSASFNAGVEERYGKGWHREPDTLDTFMCSSWYYYRYLDPNNSTAFASPEALKQWMPVDFYLGGAEHVNGHLLYARFFTKVLYDAGYIDFDEPFTVHRHQGLILGEDNRKMSKRWGNVINPTDVVNEYGADTCRMYEMFMGPLEETKPWSTGGVKGVRRFLEKVWKLQETIQENNVVALDTSLHKLVKKVTEDTATLQFNTAIAKMMEFVNAVSKEGNIGKEQCKTFVLLLAPYAPHLAEELWATLGYTDSVTRQSWPVYDETKVVDDTYTLAVQVNGKLRATLTVATTINEQEATTRAMQEPNVQKWLEGKQPKKVIYVPGKLVSIVV